MKLKLVLEKWNSNPGLRYLVIGAWNTVFSLVLLYSFFYVFTNKYYEYELGLTYLLSTVQSYRSQKRIVWKSRIPSRSEFLRFIIGAISQYLLNSLFLYLAVHDFNMPPGLVALPVVLSVTGCFYFVNKHLVFRVDNGLV